jgi:hypothetical protein
MASDKKQNEKKNKTLFDSLFGNPWDLSDEELDMIYREIQAGEAPLDAVYAIARRAGTIYRSKDERIPEHLSSALKASRPYARLEDLGTEQIQRLLLKLKVVFSGPVRDVVHAYRGVSEITEHDRDILEGLGGELEDDWSREAAE